MAVPKQRHTKSRRNKRRSHLALKKQRLSVCPKCSRPIIPHHLCENCGSYNKHEVVDVLAKLNKKEKKKKEKEIANSQENQNKALDMENLSKK